MHLLFITQKLHGQDAFTVLWVQALRRLGYNVTVLCLEWRPEEAESVLGFSVEHLFPVISLGKEKGVGKLGQIVNFWKAISHENPDRVFIHMTPVWGIFGAPIWILRRTPVYLWYTHYKMQFGLKLLGWYGRRLFCATPQSLPQYKRSAKKVVVGHGIDLSIWKKRHNACTKPEKLLMVHRLARSKRVELSLHAMTLLPKHFTLDIYGIEPEPAYAAQLHGLVKELNLQQRVHFHPSRASKDLPFLYSEHRLILNMASETIDKSMLEAMTCGCYPVTTRSNAAAIGIPAAPAEDTPDAIAAFVQSAQAELPMDVDALYRVVSERHSLDLLVQKMDRYIRPGI